MDNRIWGALFILAGIGLLAIIIMPPMMRQQQKDNWNQTDDLTALKTGNYYHKCQVIDKSNDSVLLRDEPGRMKWFNATNEQYNYYEINHYYDFGIYDGFNQAWICMAWIPTTGVLILFILGGVCLRDYKKEWKS